MLVAKSLYLGGQIIFASECDYSFSKKFGLVCPFCFEAVFLKKAFEREQTLRNHQIKLQQVPACFSHYKTGVFCEKKALTRGGQKELQKLQAIARNQRLELYNQYLWQMFAEYYSISSLNSINKNNRIKELEDLIPDVQKQIKKRLPKYKSLVNGSESGFSLHVKQIINNLKLEAKEDVFISKNYLDKIRLTYNQKVSLEIIEFLASATAKPFLYQVAAFVVGYHLSEKQLFSITSDLLTEFICSSIPKINWIDLIHEKLKSNNSISKLRA